MKRTLWISTLVLIAVLLSACGAQTTVTPTVAPTAAATATSDATGAVSTASTASANAPDCQVYNLFTEQAEAATRLPPVSAADWKIGPDNADMTLIVYSDFQCPYCMQYADDMQQFAADHAGEVQLIYRHFPLNSHDKSTITAQAAEAAGLQGKFWEMHDLLFKQAYWDTWTAESVDEFRTWVADMAKSIDGLDADQFARDLESDAVVKRVADALASAEELQIPGTPSLYILFDGKLFFTPADQVPADAATLKVVYDLSKIRDRQYDACPPAVIDPGKSYTATLDTTKGKIVVELYAAKAPLAVNSFVFLAREGWFDNAPWHRVLKDFVAQSGDPSGTGAGGPGYVFKNEITDLKFDKPGVLGMANSSENYNGSQFFITLAAAANLDGSYTVFGQVIEGMDVVQSLTLRDPQNDPVMAEPDYINNVTIEEK